MQTWPVGFSLLVAAAVATAVAVSTTATIGDLSAGSTCTIASCSSSISFIIFSFILKLVLQHLSCLSRGNGGNERRVETTGEEHSVGHLRHQPLLDRLHQRPPNGLVVDRRRRHERLVAPARLVPPLKGALGRVVQVPGWKGANGVADVVEALHLRGKVVRLRVAAVEAVVQSGDADWVPSCEKALLLDVVEDKGVHAIEVLHKLLTAQLLVEVHDHFTVRVGDKGAVLQQLVLQHFVVVNLAVHRQNELLVLAENGLRARLNAHNGQSLVAKDVVARDDASRPVRATVANSAIKNAYEYYFQHAVLPLPFGETESFLAKALYIAMIVENCKYSAHDQVSGIRSPDHSFQGQLVNGSSG
ncbi:hypothetical protein TYRP_010712 [Tyrophagus putrescentiae]|nr:hypothetical protein TYRP_010712 [Tyrophagus putrescentiae]